MPRKPWSTNQITSASGVMFEKPQKPGRTWAGGVWKRIVWPGDACIMSCSLMTHYPMLPTALVAAHVSVCDPGYGRVEIFFGLLLCKPHAGGTASSPMSVLNLFMFLSVLFDASLSQRFVGTRMVHRLSAFIGASAPAPFVRVCG